MSQTKSHLPFVYNPGEFTKLELIENYVIRKHEFEQIFSIINNDNMQNPPQHIIIQGQRGTGKTTLLLRLSYAIEDDPKLNKWLIPIVSDEESWGISTLAEFWKHTAEDLEDIDDDFYGISDEMEKNEEDANFEEKSFEIIQNWLLLHKKKVVLFIDNFGDLVKRFSRQEHQRFREILLTCSDLRIVAASAVVLEFTYEYSEPFFEFFKVFNLQSIKKKEAESLLLKLGESYKSKEVKKIIENNPQRVEAIRRITNGVPRTIVLLYEIFIDNENGNAFRDLEFTLDKITPLYKHRMDDLKPISQKIVNILALNWDAMPVKDISLQAKIISKQVSAQLLYLEKNDIVTKQRTNTKNHLYYLSERFFNIWYLMRRGRKKHRNKVRFLVEFLELWCTPGQLLDVVSNLKEAMHKGTVYEKHALYMTEALARTSLQPKAQHTLITETREYLKSKKSELVNELSHSDFEIYSEVVDLLRRNEEEKALRIADRILSNNFETNFLIGSIYNDQKIDFKKSEEYYLKAIEKDDSRAMNNLALLYEGEYKDYKKAEKYYLKAIENDDSGAMNNLALLYEKEYKDYKKSEEYYLKAIEKDNSIAMSNLALLYEEEYKDYKKSEEYYLKAIEKDDSRAMNNLALLYEKEYRDYKKSEEYYLKAIEKDDSGAMFNLALLYEKEYKDYKKAEEYYLKAIEKNNSGAMNNLAGLYEEEYKDYKKAEEYYLKAIEKDDSRAMNNLALLYEKEYKDYKKAEEYYLKAIEKDNSGAMNNLALLYEKEYRDYKKAEEYYLKAIEKDDSGAMFNLALLYEKEYKDYKKAEEYYLKAIEKDDSRAMNNLALLYEKEYKDYKKAEEYYLKAIKSGNSSAFFNLALLYEKEYKDFKKAEEYYLKAIDSGYSGAMVNLALLYQSKHKDYKKAEEYYLKAIESGYSTAMTSLALLYESEYKDYRKAEKYFLKAIESGDSVAMNYFAWILFERKDRKEEALKYARQLVLIEKDFNFLHTLLIILLWNEDIEEAVKLWNDELFKEEFLENQKKEISEILTFFIAKKQYSFIYNIFKENKFEIKDRYKSIYFALLHFMDNEYETERKKMGPEFKETVDEIIETILKLQEDYN